MTFTKDLEDRFITDIGRWIFPLMTGRIFNPTAPPSRNHRIPPFQRLF